jgi:hypothetical protein
MKNAASRPGHEDAFTPCETLRGFGLRQFAKPAHQHLDALGIAEAPTTW